MIGVEMAGATLLSLPARARPGLERARVIEPTFGVADHESGDGYERGILFGSHAELGRA